jgi:hypothetical protein
MVATDQNSPSWEFSYQIMRMGSVEGNGFFFFVYLKIVSVANEIRHVCVGGTESVEILINKEKGPFRGPQSDLYLRNRCGNYLQIVRNCTTLST